MIRGVAAACLAACALACAPGRDAGRAAPVGAVVVVQRPVGEGERYAGSPACRGCHPKAWEAWRATGHAGSLEGLPPADAADPVCLRCHATGYGDPLGYGGAARGRELGAVGCEACHGPGAEHAGSRYPELVPTRTGGECPPCEVNRICRSCHTPERSPGFDLARDLRRIACRGGGRAR